VVSSGGDDAVRFRLAIPAGLTKEFPRNRFGGLTHPLAGTKVGGVQWQYSKRKKR
jgi:hypothetical protein